MQIKTTQGHIMPIRMANNGGGGGGVKTENNKPW